MLTTIYIYIKTQGRYLTLLTLFLVIPLAMFFQFSTYPLTNIQYVVLGYLLISQYGFYKEKKHRKKLEPKIVKQLYKELKRPATTLEINRRVNFIVDSRFITILIASLLIIFVMIYYKQF